MLSFLVETFALGLKNLRLHKLRSLLTALGIIFGVAAVIAMVAIGAGAQASARKQMEKLGATNILVKSVQPPESNQQSGRTSRVLEYGLKYSEEERFRTNLPHLRLVVPVRNTELRVMRGAVRAPQVNAIATTNQLAEVLNFRIDRGRFLSRYDEETASQVCVLGALAAKQLFPFEDPLGSTITVGVAGSTNLMLTVVGVLQPTGLAADDKQGITTRDIDMDIYFPLELSRRAFGDTISRRETGSFVRKNIQLSEIWLQVHEISQVEPVSDMARNVAMIGRNPRALDVDVKAPIQILRNAEQLNRLFNFIMVGIASFSLVVGGIGIMNIMLATVTERTREIGIRRALGAKRHHITLQFLIETTVISLTGGFIGVVTGCIFAVALPILIQRFNQTQDYPTQIAPWSVIGSFVVSGLIGVVFGLYPAIKAAWMNPIDALRHE